MSKKVSFNLRLLYCIAFLKKKRNCKKLFKIIYVNTSSSFSWYHSLRRNPFIFYKNGILGAGAVL